MLFVRKPKSSDSFIHYLDSPKKTIFFFLQNNLERRENTDKTKEAGEIERIKNSLIEKNILKIGEKMKSS